MSSRPDPQDPDSGVKIQYDEVVDGNGFVTGSMIYSDPAGRGTFRIYVSGQPDTVDSFQGSVILDLFVEPLAEDDPAVLELRMRTLQRARERYITQIEAIEGLLNVLDNQYQLSEEELRLLEAQAAGPSPLHDSDGPDLRRDRLIEIEPLDDLSGLDFGRLVLGIDPSVPKDACDIYALRGNNEKIEKVTAKIPYDLARLALDGNPDLYLYRGGVERDHSDNPGRQPEMVVGESGSGSWSLHVYGRDVGTQYSLAKEWYFKHRRDNDRPDKHPL